MIFFQTGSTHVNLFSGDDDSNDCTAHIELIADIFSDTHVLEISENLEVTETDGIGKNTTVRTNRWALHFILTRVPLNRKHILALSLASVGILVSLFGFSLTDRTIENETTESKASVSKAQAHISPNLLATRPTVRPDKSVQISVAKSNKLSKESNQIAVSNSVDKGDQSTTTSQFINSGEASPDNYDSNNLSPEQIAEIEQLFPDEEDRDEKIKPQSKKHLLKEGSPAARLAASFRNKSNSSTGIDEFGNPITSNESQPSHLDSNEENLNQVFNKYTSPDAIIEINSQPSSIPQSPSQSNSNLDSDTSFDPDALDALILQQENQAALAQTTQPPPLQATSSLEETAQTGSNTGNSVNFQGLAPNISENTVSNNEFESPFTDDPDNQFDSEQSNTNSENAGLNPIDLISQLETPLQDDSNNSVELAWLESFDGPGLDLRRFETPGSELFIDDGVLKMSLAAIHTDEYQNAQLEQRISLNVIDEKLNAQIKVSDFSMFNSENKSTSSNFTLAVPLVRINSNANTMSELSARFTMNTEPNNERHSVTLGIYEINEADERDSSTNSLGQTTFLIGADSSSGDDKNTTLNFLIDMSDADHLELAVNDNRLSIPVKASFPEKDSNVEFKLSANGASGEFSRINVALENLDIDGQNINNIEERLITNNLSATVGHSLNVHNGMARIRAVGSNDAGRVLLATRSDLTPADWVNEIESTTYTTNISLRNFIENNISSPPSEAEFSEPATIYFMHTLFETSTPEGDQHVIAGLEVNPHFDSNLGRYFVGVKARVTSIDTLADRSLDWYTAWQSSDTVSEAIVANNSAITNNSISVKIEVKGNQVLFTWDGITKALSLDDELPRWFPSMSSSTAMVVEANSRELFILDINSVGVVQR